MLAHREETLLERDAELAALAGVAERALSGTGGVLVVEGPAGIGKSHVLEVASARSEAAGLRVAGARAGELERDFPFGVVRQLLEPLLASVRARDRDDVLAGPAGIGVSALRDLEPADVAPVPEASYATLHGLYWLTANLAARKPLLIAIDDAHWADGPSLRFIAYLAKRIEELSASIVLVRRSGEDDSEVLDAIASDSAAVLVRPAPLTEAAVTALVRASISDEASDRFCAACHRATRGNPFLLRELLRSAAEQHVVATDEDAARVEDVAPETVGRSVLRRLGHLSRAAATLARTVAVLGDEAEAGLVARVADLDPLTVAEAADVLMRNDVFASGRPLTFAHPIVRTAVYTNLPPRERVAAHCRAARALAEQQSDLDRAATHLLATDPVSEPWALEVLRKAARGAASRGAPDVGATYLRRALSEPLSRGMRAEVLVELGLAEVAAKPPLAGIAHLREALAIAEGSRNRAVISLEVGRALSDIVDFPAAVEVLERALAELDPEDRDLAERLEAQLTVASMMSLSTATSARQRLARLVDDAEAGRVTDPSLLAAVGFFCASFKEPASAAADLAARALAGGRPLAERDQLTLSFAASTLIFADRLEAAMQVWDETLAEARRSGSVPLFATASTFRSHVAWRLGAIPMAEADARAALDVVEVQFGVPVAVMVLVDALIERGELEAAAEAVAESGIGGPLPELMQFNIVLESRGRLRLAQGRVHEALDDLRECGRRLEAWGVRNPGTLPWRSSAAIALSLLGERDEALALALEEVELARRFEVPRELGIALRATGLIEGGDGGIERLREAVAVLEASPARLELGRALTDLGAAIRRSGRRAEAREPLRRGLELAERCGATALAERAHDELLTSGARPRRATLTGVDSLTASERRIAEMAAGGLSNREIAQALFVTEKTIEWHLGQVYRKLDIRSRSELGPLM